MNEGHSSSLYNHLLTKRQKCLFKLKICLTIGYPIFKMGLRNHQSAPEIFVSMEVH